MEEKRRYHRLAMQMPIAYRVPPDEQLASASLLDISGTGLAFVTSQEVKVRHELLLYLSLPETEDAEMRAKVVRVEKQPAKGDASQGHYRVGVRVADHIAFDEKRFARFYAGKLLEAFSIKES